MQVSNMIQKNHLGEVVNFTKEVKPNNHHNAVLRKRAENKGEKSYAPVAPCKACKTSERSVKSNICLECDRRRAKEKMIISASSLIKVGEHLVTGSKEISFFHNGKQYILQAVEVTK